MVVVGSETLILAIPILHIVPVYQLLVEYCLAGQQSYLITTDLPSQRRATPSRRYLLQWLRQLKPLAFSAY